MNTKILCLSVATASILAAADYKVSIGSFDEEFRAIKTVKQAEVKLKNMIERGDVTLGHAKLGDYHVALSKISPEDKKELRRLLTEIRDSGYHDAFILRKKQLKKAAESTDVKAHAEPAVTPATSRQTKPASSAALENKEMKPVAATTLEKKLTVDRLPPKKDTKDIKRPFTLNQGITEILNTHPALANSEFNYINVGKDLRIAKNAYYPTLDAYAQYGYSRETISEKDAAKVSGSGAVARVGVQAIQNLYNGGYDQARIESQSHRLDSAAYTHIQTADRLNLAAVQAYLDVIKNKKLVDIAEKNVVSHKNVYGQIKEKVAGGFSTAGSEKQVGTRLALAESNLIAAKNNLQDALSTFEKVFGKRIEPERLVTPDFAMELPKNIDTVLNAAYSCNPSLLVEFANDRMSKSVINEKKSAFKPKLNLEVGASHYYQDNMYNGRKTNDYEAMLKLTYNIYNKGIDSIELEKAQVGAMQSESAIDNMKRDLKESTEFSWQIYNFSKDKLVHLKDHLRFAKETLDAYSDEFKVGRRDLINLLDAESEYDTAQQELVKTEHDILYAQYRLLDNMGVITDAFVPGYGKKYIAGACSLK